MFIINVFFVGFSLTLILSILNFIKVLMKPIKKAPGPFCLPLIGYHHLLFKDTTSIISQLTKTYGDLFKVKILGREYFFLNSLETVKEALVTNGNYTSNRPNGFSLVEVILGKSLSTANGLKWISLRKLVVKGLSGLRYGKQGLDVIVKVQVDKLVADIEQLNGQEHDYLDQVLLYTTNVASVLLVGKEYTHNDPDYIQLKRKFLEITKYFPGIELLLYGPLFHQFCLRKRKKVEALRLLYKQSHDYYRSLVDEKVVSYNGEEPSNVLDYFVMMHLREESNEINMALFDKDAIADSMSSLVLSNADMYGALLYNGLLHLSLRPDIQEQLYVEIEKNIGLDGRVSMTDQSRLHYTMAFIHELQRFVEVTPFGFTRSVSKDITIGGCEVRQGSHLVVNYKHILMNPRYFKNPEQFDLNNFLDSNGHFVKNSANIAFSLGQRSCIGFFLSQVQSFIALVTLVQKFRWIPAAQDNNHHHINFSFSGEGVPRLQRFSVRAIVRSQNK